MDTSKHGSFIKRGKARGEALTASNLAVMDGKVYMSSYLDSKVLEMDENLTLLEEYTFNPSFYKALPYKDSTFLVLSEFTSGNRLETRKLDGSMIDTVGSFPTLKDSPDIELNNAWMQGDMTMSPDKRHVAVACYNYEYIDVYDKDLNLAFWLTGPKDIPQKTELTKADFGYFFDQPDKSFVYHSRSLAIT